MQSFADMRSFADMQSPVGMTVCRHLDADEAIVRGAALYAANLSTTFRLNRKFGMTDGVVYPVSFLVSLKQAACHAHRGRQTQHLSVTCHAIPASAGVFHLRLSHGIHLGLSHGTHPGLSCGMYLLQAACQPSCTTAFAQPLHHRQALQWRRPSL